MASDCFLESVNTEVCTPKSVQVQQVHVHVCVHVDVLVQVLLPVVHPWRRPSPSPACLPPPRPVNAFWIKGLHLGSEY